MPCTEAVFVVCDSSVLAISKTFVLFLSRNCWRDFSRFLNENDDSIQKFDQLFHLAERFTSYHSRARLHRLLAWSAGSQSAAGWRLSGRQHGDSNTALGISAGLSVTTASNVICIGTEGANVNNSCFIGNIYSNVQPIVGMGPDSVTITSTGRLGRGNVSSRRYKHDIEPIAEASELLYALKPVSFRFNKEV